MRGSRSSTHHVVSSVLFSCQHLPLLHIYVDSLPGQSLGQKTLEHELSCEASLGLTDRNILSDSIATVLHEYYILAFLPLCVLESKNLKYAVEKARRRAKW